MAVLFYVGFKYLQVDSLRQSGFGGIPTDDSYSISNLCDDPKLLHPLQ